MENLPKNATMDPVLFLVLEPKNHHLYSCVSIDGSTLAKKKTTLKQAYKCIFRPEMAVNQKSVNQGMISARHTTNRQSFIKVTCPFKYYKIFICKGFVCRFPCYGPDRLDKVNQGCVQFPLEIESSCWGRKSNGEEGRGKGRRR